MEQEGEIGPYMSSMITVTSSGDFKKTFKFLQAIKSKKIYDILDEYGRRGVEILSSNTPIRTGATASSWGYSKTVTGQSITIEWYNTRLAMDGRTPLVVLIIKGHGTRTGGYVAPNDFVTEPMQALFEEAIDAVWKAVNSL